MVTEPPDGGPPIRPVGESPATDRAYGQVVSRRTVAFDISLAILMCAVAGLSLYVGSDAALTGPAADYPRPLGIAAILVVNLGIAARRRFPVATLGVVAVAYLPMLLG